MARRERNEQLRWLIMNAPVPRAAHQRPVEQTLQRLLDIAVASGIENDELLPDCSRCVLYVFRSGSHQDWVYSMAIVVAWGTSLRSSSSRFWSHTLQKA